VPLLGHKTYAVHRRRAWGFVGSKYPNITLHIGYLQGVSKTREIKEFNMKNMYRVFKKKFAIQN
jgi:hypothetical protein